MKFGAILFSGLLASALWAGENPGLEQVKSVYLLPMGNGLDQYLANRITKAGVFEVVTDPQRADAIFTDRLGPAFEARLNELYPAVRSKPAEAKEEGKKEKEAAPGSGLGDTTATGAVPVSSFGRSKGTLFLVGVRNHAVLWSTYERPKDTTSRRLDRAAGRIAEQLTDTLNPKKK